MRVFYNVAHDGLLIKAIAHRYRYHLNDYAVFLINRTLHKALNVKAFERTRFIHIDMANFSKSEGRLLENRITDYVKFILRRSKIDIKIFGEIYCLVDEVDPFGVYLGREEIPYIQIETEENILKRFYDTNLPIMSTLRERNTYPRSYDYDILVKKYNLRDSTGKHCKYAVFMETTNTFPPNVTNASDAKRWNYMEILRTFSDEYLKKILELFKFESDKISRSEVSIIVIASRLAAAGNKGMRDRGIASDKDIDTQFVLMHQLMADFFAAKQYYVYFKPHPREIEFVFPAHMSKAHLIPAVFPTELLYYVKQLKIRELISTTSSSGLYFQGTQRPNNVLLGNEYGEFYPHLIKIFTLIEILKFCKSQLSGIYVSGIPETLTDMVLKRDYSENLSLFRIIQDVQADDSILLVLNSMTDNDRKKLQKLMLEEKINFAAVFFSKEDFFEVFGSEEHLKYIKTIRIKKMAMSANCIDNLDDELIYLFEKGTSYFNDINQFKLTKKLTYTNVKLEVQPSKTIIDTVAVNDKYIPTKAKEETPKEEDTKEEKVEKKAVKYREDGILVSEDLDYSAIIENGVIMVRLTEVPSDICIGYELMRNLKVVETLPPSFVTSAEFSIKSFGDYSVRFRFYNLNNLTRAKYRFDTLPLVYDTSNVVRTLNPDGYDFRDSLNRLERILFEERLHNQNMSNQLSVALHESNMGFTFVDYLVMKGVKSIYFYCEERDWEFGSAFYHMLFTDKRIKIMGCVSEIAYAGISTGSQYHTVRFSPVKNYYYNEEDSVFIVSAYNVPRLFHEFKSLGVAVYESQIVINSTLAYGADVFPYKEFVRRYPEVELILVQNPLLLKKTDKKLRSVNENDIVAKKVNLKMISSWLRESPPNIPPALESCGVTLEDAKEFAVYTIDLQSKDDGWGKPANRLGELVSVVDGYRKTTDQPETPSNCIYLFGNRMIYSPFTSNEKTAASFLQRLINDYTENIYKIINCGGWVKSTQSNMFRVLLDVHNYDKGDKVIVMVDSFPDAEEVKYTRFELNSLFERPHDFGEIWVDDMNINETGERLIAEALFKNLCEINSIKEKKITETAAKKKTNPKKIGGNNE